jgi:hypothetical protein
MNYDGRGEGIQILCLFLILMVLRHDMTLAGCKARLSFKDQAIIQLHSEIT